MEFNDLAEQIGSLSALDEPLRRKLYLYVVGRAREVSRDEAARAARISRALAAFHLDRLVKAGLLEATFQRLSARSGPGAGRPSKLYRRAATRFEISLPQQRYELAAHVLAQALAGAPSEEARARLRMAAHDWGRRLAQDPSVRAGRGLPLHRASRALEACGFEPRRMPDGEVVLGNCPFDSLRTDCRELTCGMNLALIEGLVSGLELQGVYARPAPREGLCCVALRDRPEEPS